MTNINGGQGADFISYTVNAPVNIPGGEGLDTLTVVGTEFGDDFVVTESGIFGAVLSASYIDIKHLVLDAMAGNDTFFIAGTSSDVAVTLVGGLGSDKFNVGGGNVDSSGNEIPISVVSNDLKGHSGLLSHTVTSVGSTSPLYTGVTAPDLSVNVSDNEDAAVVILNGNLRVFEDLALSLTLVSYLVVLSKAPSQPVRVNVVPTRKTAGTDETGITVNGNAIGAVLLFNETNWFTTQTVTVAAINDAVAEGFANVEIKHSVMEGSADGDGDDYDQLPVRSVFVDVVDDDQAGVQILKSGDGNQVSEGGSTDTYSVMLTGAPSANVTVTVTVDGDNQLLVRTSSVDPFGTTKTLTFTPTNWNTPQVVTIQAVEDSVREGHHFSRITHTASGTGDYADVSVATVDMTIIDNDVPGVVITQSDGSTDVIEPTATVYTAGGTVQSLAAAGTTTIFLAGTGESGTGSAAQAVREVSGNDSALTAQDLDLGPWSVTANTEILNATTIPHITVAAKGEGRADFFRFTVTEEELTAAGNSLDITIDIDPTGGGVPWFGTIVLQRQGSSGHAKALPAYQRFGWSAGTTLTANSDMSAMTPAPASDSVTHAMLGAVITTPGTYTIKVTDRSARGVPNGAAYNLHVSREAHVVPAASVTKPVPVQEKPVESSGLSGQDIDSQDRWFTLTNAAVGVSSAGTLFASNTVPYTTIEGSGDGRPDYYQFTVSSSDLTSGSLQGLIDIDRFVESRTGIPQTGLQVSLQKSGGANVTLANYGSDGDGNPLKQFTITEAGTYIIRVGADHYISWRSFFTNLITRTITSGVPANTQYRLNLSLQGHAINQEQLSLVGKSIRIPVTGGTIVREIVSYNTNGSYTLDTSLPSAVAAGTSFEFGIPTGVRTDTYQVVLTSAPAAGETVRVSIAGANTRTYNSALAFETDGSAEHNVPQVSTDPASTVLEFNTTNWNIPQTVTVSAVDDSFADGQDAQVFAGMDQVVNRIRGPVNIVGGERVGGEQFLNNPVMLPGETNFPQAEGSVSGADSVIIGGVSHARFSDTTAEYFDASATGFDPLMNSYPYSITFINGDLHGREFTVDSVSGTTVTFTEAWPEIGGVITLPAVGDQYFITPLNLNLKVTEAEQVDVLNVWNTQSPTNESMTLTDTNLSGLGMGQATEISGENFDGGITYAGLESVNIHLGSGNQSVTVVSTHAGDTSIFTGSGADDVRIKTISGHTLIHTGTGQDSVIVSSDDLTIDQMTALLTVVGDGTGDSLTLNDSHDTNDNTGTLTATTLTGFDMPSVAERQTVRVQATGGSFQLTASGLLDSSGAAKTVTIAFAATAEDFATALVTLFSGSPYNAVANDIAVTRAADGDNAYVYSVSFVYHLAGQNMPKLESVPTGDTLTFTTDISSSVEVTEDYQGSTAPARGNLQTLTVSATSGSFSFSVAGQTVTINVSGTSSVLQQLQDELNAVLNPNNSNPNRPYTNNFSLTQIGDTYEIVFRGSKSAAAITSLNTSLLSGTAVLETRTSGVNYYGISSLNLDLGSGHDTLSIRSTSASTFTNIRTGAGNDSVIMSSSGDLLGTADLIAGDVRLDAQSGANSLLFVDVADTSGDSAIVLDRAQPEVLTLTGITAGDIQFSASGGNYSPGVTILGGSGGNSFTIAAVFAGGPTFLSAGTGADTVVASAFTDDDGTLTVQGQATSSDTLVVNAEESSGVTGTLQSQILELANYTYNASALSGLDSRLTHSDVQGALARANRETQIGVLERLRTGALSSTSVSLTVDTVVSTSTPVTMTGYLTTLMNAVNNLVIDGTASQLLLKQNLQGFVTRGRILIDAVQGSTTSRFSVATLDELLTSAVLLQMKAAGSASATSVETALSNLRGYLTLSRVSSGLQSEGYTWVANAGGTPVVNGQRMQKTGNAFKYTVTIDQVQDDAGGYLPKQLTISRKETISVSVPASYVSGRDSNSVSTAGFDLMTGLNPGGLWSSGFETVTLNINTSSTGNLVDNITIKATEDILNLTVNTGDGADVIAVVDAAQRTLTVNSGAGADQVSLSSLADTLSVQTGSGNDSVTIEQSGGNSTVETEDGDDTVSMLGASGNLTVRTGAGDDQISIPSVTATLLLQTGSGNDTVTVQQSGVTSTIQTEDGDDIVSLVGASGNLTVSTGAGADQLSISSVSGTLNVQTGSGNDSVAIENSGGNSTIATEDGDDTVSMLNASGNLTVTTGSGVDVVTISSVATALSVQAGDGNDIVMVLQSSGT
ncbi:MAG: hypothetical protein WCK86_16260, partial [Planctomycetia bacterium]